MSKPMDKGMPAVLAHGWRRARGVPSLREVWGSIPVAAGGWRKLFAFLGPGYLVSTGYMDPGNWATALAGGAQFGYTLLVIALISNLMAILLQALCARLGFATSRDLAQACRDAYPRPVSFVLWIFAEIAICATDLAEVIGTAIGLNLLFGIPLELGVFITALDVLLILYLQNLGFRWIEAFIVTMLGVIAVCFGLQIAMAQPDLRAVITGFAPTVEIVSNPDMLYLAMGILGATVMPHNLYLHSSIVQTRLVADTLPAKREAIKYATIDSTIALMLALTVNASILILAAATFNRVGETGVADIGDAHKLLAPLLGSPLAATLFGVALLCCGLNSTVTATLSGQIVMEGFINVRPTRVGAAARDTWYCDCARHCRYRYLRRQWNRQAPDPQPGRPQHAATVRDRAAHYVHTRSPQDGRADRAALDDDPCGHYRRGRHSLEYQGRAGCPGRVGRE
jgi:manganese transport protein